MTSISEQLRHWADLEREAIQAEEAWRKATQGQMQQSPQLLELQRTAGDLRRRADALLQDICQEARRLESDDN